MKRPHKHAALIHLWADGATIWHLNKANDCYEPVPDNRPSWDEDTEYFAQAEP